MRVPYECGIMTARELVLTDKDATELLQLMATGQVTSYELTLAFCRRAAIAQQLVSPSEYFDRKKSREAHRTSGQLPDADMV